MGKGNSRRREGSKEGIGRKVMKTMWEEKWKGGRGVGKRKEGEGREESEGVRERKRERWRESTHKEG